MSEMLKYIGERLNKYRTYYEVLHVNPKEATDEKVKEAYENECNKFKIIMSKYKEKDAEEIKSLVQTMLDDAYNALKTKDSREHYQDILDKIEENER